MTGDQSHLFSLRHEVIDGLLDGIEDSDHDGTVDATETDPKNSDTDGDSFSDSVEIAAGTDPLDPNSKPTTSTMDGTDFILANCRTLKPMSILQVWRRGLAEKC